MVRLFPRFILALRCLTADMEQTTFVPLNVEIEEESEDEIDDSKEIQVCCSASL